MEGKKCFLFVLNNGPYGNELSYNGLRMALSLVKREEASVKVFLMGDGVNCAVKDQKTPDGYYNIGRMINSIVRRGDVAT